MCTFEGSVSKYTHVNKNRKTEKNCIKASGVGGYLLQKSFENSVIISHFQLKKTPKHTSETTVLSELQ